MAQEIRDVVFNIQVRTEDGAVKIDGLTKGFVKAETAFKKMQTTLNSTNEAIKGAGISTGLANTAILEFGRTVSDAPYGIQGMGNNISQLASIFGQMAQAAKESGDSIQKALRTAFFGPLGIIVAVQVAVAGIELLYRTLRKGKKEAEDFKKSVDQINESYNNQQAILGALGSAALFSPEARQTFAENMKEIKEYLEAAETVGEITPQVIDEAIRLGVNLLEARRKAAIAEKEYLELIKDPNNDRVAAGIKLAGVLKELTDAENALILKKQEDVVVTDKIIEQTREQVKEVDELQRISFALGRDVNGKTIFENLFPLLRDKEGNVIDVVAGQTTKRLIKIGEKSVAEFQEWAKQTQAGREGGQEDWLLRKIGLTPEQFAEKAEMIQQGLNAAFDLVDARFERELALEKNKTTALNDQLRLRLRNEQLTAEERDKINQQISNNEADLVKRQNEIEKKRFQLNKAQGISNAIINTSVAVSKVLPNIPLAAFVGALGAAQVATIASQAFVQNPSPNPNLVSQGSSGPAESQSPAFNIVGASGQSQLAQAIAAQQRDPVRAYVVAGEVTTAQSLERNKIQEASI
jgi:hypothetical protein